jgi:hypothetical protein
MWRWKAGSDRPGFQFLKTAEAEQEAVEHGQKHALRGDVGTVPGIPQLRDGRAEAEDLVAVAGEGGQAVSGCIFHSNNCKNNRTPNGSLSSRTGYLCLAGWRARRNNSRLMAEIFSRSSLT